MSWKLTAWLNVSCEAGCQIAVRSPSQCIWSVSVTPPPAAVDPLAAGDPLAAVVGAALGDAVPPTLGAVDADGWHAAATSSATIAIDRRTWRMGPSSTPTRNITGAGTR